MKITLKTMQKSITPLLITTALLFAVAHGQETHAETDEVKIENVTHGGQASLRGLTDLDVTRKADSFKRVPKDRHPYVSDYVINRH